MTNIILEIDNVLSTVEVLAERTGVMLDDVDQSYFSQSIKGMDDAWKVMPPLYDTARIKIDIAQINFFDMMNRLKELRDLVNKTAASLREMKEAESQKGECKSHDRT